MTRKHFTAIAWELRQAYPQPMVSGTAGDLASDFYAGRVRGWEDTVSHVASACAESNGAFDRGRFLVAAGYVRRADGSMFPMAAPR
jgi:hypothetical protein